MKNLEAFDTIFFFDGVTDKKCPGVVTFAHPNETVNVRYFDGIAWRDSVAVRVLPETEEMNSGEPFVCAADYISTSTPASGMPSPSIINRAIDQHNAKNIIIGQHAQSSTMYENARAAGADDTRCLVESQRDFGDRRFEPIDSMRRNIETLNRLLNELYKELDKSQRRNVGM